MMQLFASASSIAIPHVAYSAILPELILMGGALVLLAVSALVGRRLPIRLFGAASALISLASLGASLWLWHVTSQRGGPGTAIDHAVVVDGFSVFVLVLVSCAMFLSSLAGTAFLEREGAEGPDYFVLALLSASGAMFMGEANDLIMVFLGLEILSIALYVLAGSDARRSGSGEAAMKYFILGAFSSAVFLYGIALTYGATGSTNLIQIADYLSRNVVTSNGVLLAGIGLLVVGFGFKVAAVPFHMWTPDVYQGSPTPVTGFMAAVAKAGAFAALLRVLVSSFGVLRSDWQPLIWVLAVLTLIVGAFLALMQRDVKRMLAYSSINHAGFVLLGVQAASRRGVSGALYYLFAYTFLVVGSFAVVTAVGGKGDTRHDLGNYRGLARRSPLLALGFAILLLAQAGAPFTTGFLAKLSVVSASVEAHSYALAVIAMVSAVAAAFFYLRVVVLMYAGSLAGLPAAKDMPETGYGLLPVQTGHVDVAAEPDGGALAQDLAGGLPSAEGASAVPIATATHAAMVGAPDPAGEVGDPEAPAPADAVVVPMAIRVVVALSVAVTVFFGLYPGPLVDFARHATLLIG